MRASKGLPVEEPQGEDAADHLYWIWDAFCKLSRRRVTNETGPQPITTADLVAYCTIAGITRPEEIEDLEFFIEELDILWLRKTHARIEAEREKARRKAQRR